LKVGDAGGIVDVCFSPVAPVILSGVGHAWRDDGLARWTSSFVHFERIHSEELEGRSLNSTCGSDKAFTDHRYAQSENHPYRRRGWRLPSRS
jgi:hypothetical protein